MAEYIDSDSAAQVPVPVDVHTQVPLDEEGAVQVLVPVDDSVGTAPVLIDGGVDVQVPDREDRGDNYVADTAVYVKGGGAAHVHNGEGATVATGDDIQAQVVQRADVADNIDAEGSAVIVLVGGIDDMTNVVEDQGAAPV